MALQRALINRPLVPHKLMRSIRARASQSRKNGTTASAAERSMKRDSAKGEDSGNELVVKKELRDGTTLFCFGTKDEIEAIKQAAAKEEPAAEDAPAASAPEEGNDVDPSVDEEATQQVTAAAKSGDLSRELVEQLDQLVVAIDNHMIAEAAAATKQPGAKGGIQAPTPGTRRMPVPAPPSEAQQGEEDPLSSQAAENAAEEEEEEEDVWDRPAREAILSAVYGTNRGLDASADVRARLEEALVKLEGANNQPRPSQTMPVLAGRWKLVYTTSPQVLAVLGAIQALPVVTVGDVTQVVDGESLEVQNKVEIAVPFMLSLSAHAGFEVRSPQMLKLKYHKAEMDSGISIATPQLFAGLEVPDELSLLGQTLDLRPLRAALDPVLQTVQAVGETVTPRMNANAPFPSSYLVITYLDEGLQISRDHVGGVFVMVKDEEIFGISRLGLR